MNFVQLTTTFFVVALISSLFVWFVRGASLNKRMLDQPNERSSHSNPVPRLGGAAFVPVVLLALLLGGQKSELPLAALIAFFLSVVAIYVVGVCDDIKSLGATTRFAVQLGAASGFVMVAAAKAAGGLQVFGLPVWLVCSALTLWLVGLLNIYNFMDGVDGLAGLQAAVAGVGWAAIASGCGAPFMALLGAVVAAGATGFLWLNWPPAKIFMGDAGSTVLGFIFAGAPILLSLERGNRAPRFDLLCGVSVLLVWPFLADGVFTILRRLTNRENIFAAHCSHLYQRLVKCGVSHAKVTCFYGILAAGGGVAGWALMQAVHYAFIAAILWVVGGFALMLGWTVRSESATGPRGSRPI